MDARTAGMPLIGIGVLCIVLSLVMWIVRRIS
jgi:hypothetical protein